jgi:predicted RNase H-like HicB family nuclease
MESLNHLGETADDVYRNLYDALELVFETTGCLFDEDAQSAMMLYDNILRQALGMPEHMMH